MEQTSNKRNKAWLALLLISSAALLISAAVLVSNYSADAAMENEFDVLSERVKSAQQNVISEKREETAPHETDQASSGAESTDTSEEPAYELLNQYAGLYQENPELGGWIRIDGTVIDYPVMFTPEEPEKYLHLSFEGKYSKRGVPFIGEGCAIAPRSQNIVVYGHHMKNGSMFAAIVKYKDIDFWRQHPRIYFSTLYEEGEYEVFAVFETDIYAAEKLRCYSFINARDEADFSKYIADIQDVALYSTGVKVSYGDALLTLSPVLIIPATAGLCVVARKIND
jgi:sortase B